MRVLGVVTLISPLGEYGGPTRVAVNQLNALRDRGHDVVLAGAHQGFGENVPREIEGVPARLYPARRLLPGTGYAGLAAPGLWRALHRHAREFDVVHVHAARDLVTLPAARIALQRGVPVVLQTHGMIDESDHPLAAPLDAALTRPVLRNARWVTYLTSQERGSLEAISRGGAHLIELANGVPPSLAVTPRDDRTVRVLYLARLAPRKRPVLFVEAAGELASEFPDAHFVLVGPDEGEGAAVRAAIAASGATDRIRWEGAAAPDKTIDTMLEASVYVLPSVDEPYPMSVLEAMSVGLPVIVTDSCGLAPFVAQHDAGLVADSTREALVAALRALLMNPHDAEARGARGREAVRGQRSMDAVARQLEHLYQ